jgi:hypothetical protein
VYDDQIFLNLFEKIKLNKFHKIFL